MKIEDLDLVVLSKLTSQQVELVTCLECCKRYKAPDSAPCGHTLCHKCWSQRKKCPTCSKPCELKTIRRNLPVQTLTEHVQSLKDSFEKLFNIKLEEFLMDTPDMESNDSTKHVKEWLASSQNQFSVPPTQSNKQSSEISSDDSPQVLNPLEVTASKIQIHDNSRKTVSPKQVVHVSIPQDDWDKIEPMPDIEETTKQKDKENIVGPMDLEPFFCDEIEYTNNHPRRSSRKRDVKNSSNMNNNENSSCEKNFKESSGETDLKSNKTKQNWNNVKKMRKEFSKLNKKNRNKLNVSIEMCKKSQNAAKQKSGKAMVVDSPAVYEIDDNTPSSFKPPENNTITYTENPKLCEPQVEKEDIEENVKSNQTTEENIINTVIEKETIRTDKNICNLTSTETVMQVNNDSNMQPMKMPFYKKGSLNPIVNKSPINIVNHKIDTNTVNTNDDIEITIRVGNTITNILIKKKNDIELKVNTDREVQTSFASQNINNELKVNKADTSNIHINVCENQQIIKEKPFNPVIEKLKNQATDSTKTSGKRNTDSADTTSAHFEITESVEKELSNIMECAEMEAQENEDANRNLNNTSKVINPQILPSKPDEIDLNDIDIFESGYVKDLHVEPLKNSKNCPSEIFMPTMSSKHKTQKMTKKRDRDLNDREHDSQSKKAKYAPIIKNKNMPLTVSNTQKESKDMNVDITDSEQINYDAVIGQVFANIDADIEEIKRTQTDKNTCADRRNEKETQNTHCGTVIDISTQNFNELCNQKESENMFSVCMEKDDKVEAVLETPHDKVSNVRQPNTDDLLTPVVAKNIVSTQNTMGEEVDDSDKSVVEETPQKTTSFSKMKQKPNGANKNNQPERSEPKSTPKGDGDNINKTNLQDTSTMDGKSTKELTVIDARVNLETPLNINKFVDQITYKSTPVARKSLNFDTETDIDVDQTLCATNVEIAKTTQEKEFLAKAFERTPKSTTRSPQTAGTRKGTKKFCLAGSCLSQSEIARVKLLCSRYKWTWMDKYCKEITHLVVRVDDENKSQRSVKYMCALAASKWIVSYEWVEKCLQTYNIVSEHSFEALDSTGEPGPMRSRTSNKKLFNGIKFFCMEPFGVLDTETLKEMLVSSGGTVVSEVKEVKITDKSTTPALLLAEPENTQEDRFIYMAMELNIVPVNYEWVLNCLGNYTLGSIHDLLLCPATILPKHIENWPHQLMAREDE